MAPPWRVRVVATAAALVIHMAPFVSLARQKPPPEPPAPAKVYGGTIPGGKFRDMDREGDGLACEYQYKGVGFEHSWQGKVLQIARGGPAWRAGIRVGDWMRSYEDNGDHYVFHMERGDQRIDLVIMKSDICIED